MNGTVSIARAAIALEIKGLEALYDHIGQDFVRTLELLLNVSGRIVVTGMGKSGHVANKIASTLSSTGSPAIFVHPAEASHGDLGMIARNDAILVLSKSGETSELRDLLAYAARFSIPVAAITGSANSALAKASEAVIILPNAEEACGVTRAPTTSTTMMLAAGDALAIALLRSRGFTSGDFHSFHPGGNLGAALRRVSDMMHGIDAMPLCPDDVMLADAVVVLNDGGFGCVGLVDNNGLLSGILTDGDLRRQFGLIRENVLVREVMIRNPKSVAPDTLAGDALALISRDKITALFVVVEGKPVGLIHVHDCLSTGVF